MWRCCPRRACLRTCRTSPCRASPIWGIAPRGAYERDAWVISEPAGTRSFLGCSQEVAKLMGTSGPERSAIGIRTHQPGCEGASQTRVPFGREHPRVFITAPAVLQRWFVTTPALHHKSAAANEAVRGPATSRG